MWEYLCENACTSWYIYGPVRVFMNEFAHVVSVWVHVRVCGNECAGDSVKDCVSVHLYP